MKTTPVYDFHLRRRKRKTPRSAHSYRGARRNQVIRELKLVWRGVEPDRVEHAQPTPTQRQLPLLKAAE